MSSNIWNWKIWSTLGLWILFLSISWIKSQIMLNFYADNAAVWSGLSHLAAIVGKWIPISHMCSCSPEQDVSQFISRLPFVATLKITTSCGNELLWLDRGKKARLTKRTLNRFKQALQVGCVKIHVSITAVGARFHTVSKERREWNA